MHFLNSIRSAILRGLKLFPSVGLMGAVAIVAGLACYWTKDLEGVERAVGWTWSAAPAIFARVACAMILAGFIQLILPRDWISRHLGSSSGWRGLFTATVIGAFTIGGPMTSFPVVAALVAAGADLGCVVAFVLSWSLIGIQRMVVWELPLLGTDFAAVRVAVSFLMPVLAGAWVRLVIQWETARRATGTGGGGDV